ncbi:hypothetical protein Tco_0761444 [Tanacetum coccineum]
MQLNELMDLCAKLSDTVLALENTNTSQAVEIATLKEKVHKLEKKKSLGAQEDASKQGRKIADLDADAEVTLIDETQERNDEEMLFNVHDDLQGEEVVAEKEVSIGDPVTAANVEVTTASAPTTTIDELTLIEIKVAKPKAVTTATTKTTTTRPKARGVDKGKAIMDEPEKPLKKKDQITLDEEVARNIETLLQAELEEEERLARKK